MNNRFEVCLIAAGEGSRLHSEGIKTSKPLVKIGGKTMIERLFDVVETYQPLAVHCIINEESTDLKEFLDSYSFNFPFNLKVKSTESSFHSFYELSRFVKTDHFLLATTDSIFSGEEFGRFQSAYFEECRDIDGLMAITGYIDDEKPLSVTLEGDRIVKFSDSPVGCEYATGGIYLFNKRILDVMDEAVSRDTNRLRNYLKLLLERGYHLNSFKFDKIIDVDHAEDILKAEEYLKTI